MSRIRIEPSGVEVVARDGESIMAAARRHGFEWPTVCGGNGTCRTCYLVVVCGSEHLVHPGAGELEAITEISRSFGRRDEQIRLACQVTVTGDVVVSKYGVRPMTKG